jgi:hypothetical protein
VLLAKLAAISKKLLLRGERVEALLSISLFITDHSDRSGIVLPLLELSDSASAEQKKRIFKLAIASGDSELHCQVLYHCALTIYNL